jgi:hypothetical protein
LTIDEFTKLPGPSPAATAIKHELSKIILWNEQNAPRSRQRTVGPSELGHACDRRLAYRIAGADAVNLNADPWPSIVGTSVHDWLERAVNRYQQTVEDLSYMTELRVYPDPMVKGRSDIFKLSSGTVLDWKTAGPDVMRKLKLHHDVPEGYKIQVQIYGLGHRRAGRTVNDVALVFLGRTGWLNDMYVWHAPYDEAVAMAALDRMYRIGLQLIELEIENNPHRYQLIDAAPGDSCVWCPFFNRDKDPDIAADQFGCPGR